MAGDLVPPQRNMSMIEQADFMLALRDRLSLSDGTPAAETLTLLTRADAEVIEAIGHRMARLAKFEAQIRALVAGR